MQTEKQESLILPAPIFFYKALLKGSNDGKTKSYYKRSF